MAKWRNTIYIYDIGTLWQRSIFCSTKIIMIFNLNFSRQKSKIDKNTNFEKWIFEVWTKRSFAAVCFKLVWDIKSLVKLVKNVIICTGNSFTVSSTTFLKNNYNITATIMENCNSIFSSASSRAYKSLYFLVVSQFSQNGMISCF